MKITEYAELQRANPNLPGRLLMI